MARAYRWTMRSFHACLAAFFALALVAVAAVPGSAATTRTYRYLAGTAIPDFELFITKFVGFGGTCTTDGHPIETSDGPVYQGGVCSIPVATGSVTIQVLAEAGDAWLTVELWGPTTPYVGNVVGTRPLCERVSGDGSLTLDVPDGCTVLNVYLQAPAVSGLLFVTQE